MSIPSRTLRRWRLIYVGPARDLALQNWDVRFALTSALSTKFSGTYVPFSFAFSLMSVLHPTSKTGTCGPHIDLTSSIHYKKNIIKATPHILLERFSPCWQRYPNYPACPPQTQSRSHAPLHNSSASIARTPLVLLYPITLVVRVCRPVGCLLRSCRTLLATVERIVSLTMKRRT